jgi:signal transduction histidine kinase
MKEKAPAQVEVLIVDDNEIDREAIKRYLTSSPRGYNFVFHEADSGRAALDMLDKRGFDCVFLDYRLPDMDGISLLRKIYDPETDLTRSPLVMLTGQGSETIMLDALRLGINDYLLKENISPDALHIALTKARELFDLKSSRRQAEEQLHHSRKMEAVGQLTSGVAHDFNNLLTVVTGNIHLLRRRISAGPESFSPEDIENKIKAIEAASQKGAELVRRLMVFTRQSPLSQKVVNINDCISETFALLKRTLGEEIEIQTILKEGLWPISIDVSAFENVLINFAVNARDAMPRGGKLIIETDNIMLDESYTLRHPDVTSGSYIMIAISDTGAGMPPAVAKRVFEPFFTTKPAGEGTGLGMSMAYGFVRQSGGHIYVYSEEGHGTVFRIYLPRFPADGAEKAPSEQTAFPVGRETVLVAEDDDEVRTLVVNMIEKLGYRTFQAKTARVALELLKREHKNIDLVFTDIVMPGGMNGVELVAQMREYYPGVKALYTSGYTENAIPDYLLQAGEELISKPYRREALAMKIRKVLDEKGSAHG